MHVCMFVCLFVCMYPYACVYKNIVNITLVLFITRTSSSFRLSLPYTIHSTSTPVFVEYVPTVRKKRRIYEKIVARTITMYSLKTFFIEKR